MSRRPSRPTRAFAEFRLAHLPDAVIDGCLVDVNRAGTIVRRGE